MEQARQSPASAQQLPLPLFTPTVVERRGDEFVVRVGKPVAWLTPLQFGSAVGLSADSVRRYIGTVALPESFVEWAGERRIRIRADALDHFRKHWRKQRSLEG